jgi:HEPN domain-containing protein
MSAQEWLTAAEGQIKSAQQLLDINKGKTGSFGPTVGFLVWQGAENSLKAVYVGHGKIKKDHELSTHLRIIEANNLIDRTELGKLRLAAEIVTGSTNFEATRYPENDYNYWFVMPYKDLIGKVEAALNIFQICTNIIRALPSTR